MAERKKLSARVDDELFDEIEARAKESGISKSDLIISLLNKALASEPCDESYETKSILKRIDKLETSIKELAYKAAFSSSASHFYGKQMTSIVFDINRYFQKESPLSKEEKLRLVEERDQKASEYAQKHINGQSL